MEYVNVPPPHRLEDGPEMVPGVAGTDRTVTDLAVLVEQALAATTETVPEINPAGKVTEMLFVPAPEFKAALAGMVQL
jgi:hypothetical protein